MKRSGVATVGGLLLAALGVQHAVPVRAGGELQGRQLAPARDLETGLEALIGGLLGGGQQPPPGRIESVVVTEDGDSRLTVLVSCSTGLEGRRLRGELLGRDRRVQRQFRTQPVRLEGGAREAEISFELADVAGAGVPESAYLRVSVDGGGPALKRLYVLDKAWQPGSGATGSTRGSSFVTVRPRPEALAAALPPTEPASAPMTPIVGVFTPAVDRQPRIVRDPRRRVRDLRMDAPAPAPAGPPPSPGQRAAVLGKTAGVVGALPQTGKVYTVNPNLFFVSADDRNQGAKGPNAGDVHDLLAGMPFDTDIDLDASQVAGIDVFRDQNPDSGFFYFLPRTYHLAWLADQGRYDMAMNYLAATAPGSAGEVAMAAGLTGGIDQDEIKVAERLLAAYCQSQGCAGRPQLRPFRFDPGRVAVSLAGTLGLFNIPADKVAPVGISTALGDFRVAWATDAVTKENVQLVIERGGISGGVSFFPPGTESASGRSNVQIKLADPGSFERARWKRGQVWRNPTPYPLRLKYLHALVLGAGQPANGVYSWNLGGATVAPGGRVQWDASSVPSWIDAKAVRMWVSYSLVEDCDECTRQVLKAITGGVSSVAASQITFHTMNPIAEMGAYEVAVRVRSTRFDPDSREVKEKSVVLKADNQDFTVGPIYVGEREAGGSSGPLFEYFLTVAMADGTEHEAQRWIPSADLRVLIGRSQVEKALGFVPGGRPPAEPAPAPTPAPQP